MPTSHAQSQSFSHLLTDAEINLLLYWVHLAPQSRKLSDLGFKSSDQAEQAGYFCARPSSRASRYCSYPGYWLLEGDIPAALHFLKTSDNPKLARSWKRSVAEDKDSEARGSQEAERQALWRTQASAFMARCNELGITAPTEHELRLCSPVLLAEASIETGLESLAASMARRHAQSPIWRALIPEVSRLAGLGKLSKLSAKAQAVYMGSDLERGAALKALEAAADRRGRLAALADSKAPDGRSKLSGWAPWAKRLDEFAEWSGEGRGPHERAVAELFEVDLLCQAVHRPQGLGDAEPPFGRIASAIDAWIARALSEGRAAWRIGGDLKERAVAGRPAPLALGRMLGFADAAKGLLGGSLEGLLRLGDPGVLLWMLHDESLPPGEKQRACAIFCELHLGQKSSGAAQPARQPAAAGKRKAPLSPDGLAKKIIAHWRGEPPKASEAAALGAHARLLACPDHRAMLASEARARESIDAAWRSRLATHGELQRQLEEAFLQSKEYFLAAQRPGHPNHPPAGLSKNQRKRWRIENNAPFPNPPPKNFKREELGPLDKLRTLGESLCAFAQEHGHLFSYPSLPLSPVDLFSRLMGGPAGSSWESSLALPATAASFTPDAWALLATVASKASELFSNADLAQLALDMLSLSKLAASNPALAAQAERSALLLSTLPVAPTASPMPSSKRL